MYHIGATVRVQEDDPRSDEVWGKLLNACCDSFGLCAGVGCACDGGEGEVLCSETIHGRKYKLAVSEGPTWLTTVLRLPSSLRFDLFFDEELAKPTHDGLVAFREALRSLGVPVFWTGTTDHYSQEKRNAVSGV